MSSRSWRFCCIAAGTAALVVLPPLHAQAVLTPPAMVSVGCEYVKYGMGPAHDRHESAWARASEAVKGFAPTIAMQSETGPEESCWLTSVASYAELGTQDDLYAKDPAYARMMPSLVQADGQYVSEARHYIAVLRPDLSAGEMPNILTRRYTSWEEWRIRPGQDALWEAGVKAYKAAAMRAGVKSEFRFFQVTQGSPEGTYWLFSSYADMAGLDRSSADEAKTQAAFTADDRKLFDDMFAKAVISYTSNIWNYSSSQSALTAEQRATDSFWKLKPAAAAKP